MTKSTVAHDAALSAELNAAEDVTLYHPNGKTIRVAPTDAAFWLDQGFLRDLVDVEASAQALKTLFPEALDRLLEFVTGVTKDGAIDAADGAAKATAEQAMRRLEIAYGQLIRAIETRYPMKEQGDESAVE